MASAASAGAPSAAAAAFLDGPFAAGWRGAEELAAVADPETEPYRSKYKALEELEALRQAATGLLPAVASPATAGDAPAAGAGAGGASAAGSPQPGRLELALAAVALRRGQLLIEVEQPADGEPELRTAERLLRGLEATLPPPPAAARGGPAAGPAGDAPNGAGGTAVSHAADREVSLAVLQTALNALGGLWFDRSEFATAGELLDRAERLAGSKHTAVGPAGHATEGPTAAPAAAPAAAGTPEAGAVPAALMLIARSMAGLSLEPQEALPADAAGPAPAASAGAGPVDAAAGPAGATAAAGAAARDAQYTQTLFFQAQVQGKLGRPRRAAKYCAATLRRQFEEGSRSPGGALAPSAAYEWTQNAAQLAGYHLASGQYAAAERCLAAASAVCPPGQPAAAPGGGASRDADVPANLAIAWGRLLLTRLKQSAGVDDDYDPDLGADEGEEEGGVGSAQAAEGGGAGGRSCEPGAPAAGTAGEASGDSGQASAAAAPPAAPGAPDFGPRLVLPPPADVSLVCDLPSARALFNRAAPHFRAALTHYVLDGFVSEHFNLLLDVSGLYKNLAVFEPDPHRRCVMHKARAAGGLEALVGRLNPSIYAEQHTVMLAELSGIYREIAEIKLEAGRPHGKCLAAATKALRYLDLLLEATRPPAAQEAAGLTRAALTAAAERGAPSNVSPHGPAGALAAIGASAAAEAEAAALPEDYERPVLLGRFHLARVLHRLQKQERTAGAPTALVDRALAEFSYVAAYGKCWGPGAGGLREEAGLAAEMAELLPQKSEAIRLGRF